MDKIAILIFGIQGSGKGTQSIKLSEYFAIPHISTGDIFRYEIKIGTELGRKIKDLIDSGNLVPDELVDEVVNQRLSKPDIERGFIFDGYPRTIHQAEFISKWLEDKDYDIYAVNLKVSDKEAMKRMSGRGREDDTPEAIQKRIDLYHNETKPLLKFFEEQPKINLVNINGELTIEGVYEEILKKLGEEV